MSLFRLEISSAVRIDAHREHVWDVFSDISRWTEWCGVCLRADLAEPPDNTVADAAGTEKSFGWRTGQRIRLKFRMAGIGVPFNVTVTEPGTDADAGRRVAWASTKFTVTAVRTFTFTDDPEAGTPGTTVTDHKLFTSPVLPLRLFYPRPIIRRMTEQMLTDLKAECERSPA